jgi:hypothetical protein
VSPRGHGICDGRRRLTRLRYQNDQRRYCRVVKTTDANYVAFGRDAGDRLWLKLVRKDGGRVLFSGFFSPSDSSDKSPQSRARGASERMTKLLTEAGLLR